MDRPQGLKRKRDDEDTNVDVSWDEVNGGFMDDESEPYKFGTTVLPVADLPDSFDGVPQNGLEYLFTVRREERRLPLVTKVLNPYAVLENAGSQSLKDQEDGHNSSVDAIPSQEWRQCFEQRFKNMRTNLRQSTIYVSLPESSSSSSSKVPAMRDRDRWWGFFRGDVEWESIPSSQFHGKKAGKGEKRKREAVGYEEALPQHGEKTRGWVIYEENLSWDRAEQDGVTALTYGDGKDVTVIDVDGDGDRDGEDGEVLDEESELDKDEVTATEVVPPTLSDDLSMNVKVPASLLDDHHPREPTPHVLSLLDQKTTLHLLKYFSQWIQGHFDHSFLPAPPLRPGCDPGSHTKLSYDLTPSHARWMFGLLSRLDAQLSSDEISVLRKLAREVLRLIKEERALQGVSSSTLLPSMGETAWWMIIAGVAGVWGQKDLWVDAADILR